jgi:hypothetical protein
VAVHEFPIEQTFDELEHRWEEEERLQFTVLRVLDEVPMSEVLQKLEHDAVTVQSLLESLYIAPYRDRAKQW